MAEAVTIQVNGRPVTTQHGMSLAAALMNAGIFSFGESVSGEPRGPLCGMGICMACRVAVDGTAAVKSCQTIVRQGMQVTVHE